MHFIITNIIIPLETLILAYLLYLFYKEVIKPSSDAKHKIKKETAERAEVDRIFDETTTSFCNADNQFAEKKLSHNTMKAILNASKFHAYEGRN